MLPEWFLIALIAPLIWASNYHIDKIAITKYGRGVKSLQLSLITGLAGLWVIVLLIFLDPSRITSLPSWQQIVPVFLGGVCYFFGGLLYYKGLRKEEVTRVAPLYSFSPIIAILLGGALLGEHISPVHAAGILVVVAGGILVDSRVVKHILRINWLVMLLIILSSTFLILGSIGFKKTATGLGFADTLLWFFVGSVLTSFVILLIPKNRQAFLRLFKTSKRRKLLGILLLSNIIGNIGRAAHNYAILLVPIAFVQAVEAFESAFVLVIAVLLMRFFKGLEPEDLSRKVFLQKALSVVVIVSGSLMLTI